MKVHIRCFRSFRMKTFVPRWIMRSAICVATSFKFAAIGLYNNLSYYWHKILNQSLVHNNYYKYIMINFTTNLKLTIIWKKMKDHFMSVFFELQIAKYCKKFGLKTKNIRTSIFIKIHRFLYCKNRSAVAFYCSSYHHF